MKLFTVFTEISLSPLLCTNKVSDYVNGVMEMFWVLFMQSDFEFNNEIYIQKNGILVGLASSPAIANLILKGMDELVRSCNPLFYKRFIDDLFLIWDRSEDDLMIFENRANRWQPSIKVDW